MKLHADCGMSFKIWWVLIVVLEILFSSVVAVLSGWLFGFRIGGNMRLLYTPKPNEKFTEVNHNYEFLVTSWILVVLLCLCVIRVLSASILTVGVKKSSADLSQLWIVFKGLALMISIFVLTASFTVGIYVKAAALISAMGDLLTFYFIRVLYPELDKMRKFIVVVEEKPQA